MAFQINYIHSLGHINPLSLYLVEYSQLRPLSTQIKLTTCYRLHYANVCGCFFVAVHSLPFSYFLSYLWNFGTGLYTDNFRAQKIHVFMRQKYIVRTNVIDNRIKSFQTFIQQVDIICHRVQLQASPTVLKWLLK